MLAARAENDGYVLTVAEPHRAIPALLEELDRQQRPLARLTTRHVSLEDVFVSLTGRHLRDDNRTRAAAGRADRAEEPVEATGLMHFPAGDPPDIGTQRLRNWKWICCDRLRFSSSTWFGFAIFTASPRVSSGSTDFRPCWRSRWASHFGIGPPRRSWST